MAVLFERNDMDEKNNMHPSILHLKDAPGNGQGEKTAYVCKGCGQTFARLSAQGFCERCADYELYKKVKEYVRAHDNVNEWMVADVFDIPVERVKNWIKEGYLSYKDQKTVAPIDSPESKIHGTYKDQRSGQDGWHSAN